MKSIRNWIVVSLTFLVCGLHAQGPDDQFVKIYNLLLQADQLNDSGQTEQAHEKYVERCAEYARDFKSQRYAPARQRENDRLDKTKPPHLFRQGLPRLAAEQRGAEQAAALPLG